MRFCFGLFVVLIASGVRLHAAATGPGADALELGFRSPPAAARPFTWWHWMNGHIDRAAITRDLEEMKRVGLGGAQIFNVACKTPPGPVKFFSPEWRDLFQHAAAECARLGLELSMHNCDGWSQSGGPWVTPEDAMQKVVSASTRAAGPARFDAVLPLPEAPLGHYRDIAVLAFPAPDGDARALADLAPVITTSPPRLPPLPTDGPDWFVFSRPTPGQPIEIVYSFSEPVTCRALTITLRHADGPTDAEFQVSADGVSFARVCAVPPPTDGYSFTHTTTAGFAPVHGRAFRIVIKGGSRVPTIAFRLELHGGPRLDRWEAKAGDVARPFSNATSSFAVPPAAAIRRDAVIDLTSRLQPDGRLSWDVPPGQWLIQRLGHTPTGRKNAEATDEGSGWEVDKMDARKVRAHFDAFLGPLITELRGNAGRALTSVHVDSWEALCANWTPAMRDEFRARRGYDLFPFLPVMTGRVVESVETSERFLWDLRRTIADLIAVNHFAVLRAEANRRGLKFEAEALGPNLITIGDPFQCKAEADLPMGEFWTGRPTSPDCREAASSAHLHGRPIVPAEAFTAVLGNWTEHPYSLKATGDRAFCHGINRFVIHRFVHNPWPARAPGMTMGQYGINFEPTITWWREAPSWVDYLARCQFLLQQGQAVADVLYYVGEQVPNRLEPATELQPSPPAGYAFDGCGTGELIDLIEVRDGRLVTPSGMAYRALVLPNSRAMTPRVAEKIARLVRAGGIVVGPQPDHSPSLTDQPAADQRVRALAVGAWAPPPNQPRVLPLQDLHAVLTRLGVPADFEVAGVPPDALAFTHRRVGTTEIYFVSNQTDEAREFRGEFRVARMRPELWDPLDGSVRRDVAFTSKGNKTAVPLRLEPRGSIFVVFRQPADADAQGGDNWNSYRTLRELAGPWQVSFDPRWGGPAAVEFPQLASWSENTDPRVKFFSGTATYVKEFTHDGSTDRCALSLSRVAVLARVRLNGHDLGVTWSPSYRVDLAGALRPGRNRLEISVTNLWPNRMIGDEQLPPDAEWIERGSAGASLARIPEWMHTGSPSPTGRFTFTTWRHYTKNSPLLPSGLLGPVLLEQRVSPKPGIP